MHKKTEDRGTYVPNGDNGWTISQLPEQCHRVQCFIPKTRGERDTDTLQFSPLEGPFSKIKINEFLR